MNLSELSNLTKIQEANLQEIQKEINRKTIFSGNKLTDKIKKTSIWIKGCEEDTKADLIGIC